MSIENELSRIATALEALANVRNPEHTPAEKPAEEKKPAAKKPAAKKAEPSDKLDKAAIRERLQELQGVSDAQEARAAVAKFGGKTLSDLDSANYGELDEYITQRMGELSG